MKNKIKKSKIQTKVFLTLFKRNKNSQFEWGIAIGELHDIKILIDSKHQPVKGLVWDYLSQPNLGLILLNSKL